MGDKPNEGCPIFKKFAYIILIFSIRSKTSLKKEILKEVYY